MQYRLSRLGIFLLVLSFLPILSSCSILRNNQIQDSGVSEASGQPPQWVDQRTHPEYPRAFYMLGVGSSANDSNDADNSARLDLLKQIEVEIKGEESAIQTESVKSGPGSNSVDSSIYVQSKVDSRVNMTIAGLRIEERWVDIKERRFYSLAVLNREDASGNLYRQIEDLKTAINNLINAGEEAEAQRDYKTAIIRYQDALGSAESAMALISPYKIISGEFGQSPLNANPAKEDSEKEYSFVGIQADLKTRIDRLSGKVPAASTFISWDEGIRDLILQLIRRLPEEGLLTVVVRDFKEGRSGNRVPLSNLIESDIKATIAGVEGVKVVEQEHGSEFLLTGLFRMDGEFLRINATMKDITTGTINAAGRVLIDAKEVRGRDLLPKDTPLLNPIPQWPGKQQVYPTPQISKMGGGGEGEGSNGEDSNDEGSQAAPFDIVVEQILTAENNTAPFNIKIWADKDKLRIGDPVIIYFKADRDCYITLFDQGTSGALRVLFPNPYQRDNLIRAGKTYSVPDPSAGYEIRVDGPPGIERVKAVASLNKSQLPVEISDRFIEVSPEDSVRMRDLTFALKKLPENQWADWYLEIDILPPDGVDPGRPRKLKPKRPDSPVDIIGTPGLIDKEGPGAIEPKQPEKPVDILGTPGVRQ